MSFRFSPLNKHNGWVLLHEFDVMYVDNGATIKEITQRRRDNVRPEENVPPPVHNIEKGAENSVHFDLNEKYIGKFYSLQLVRGGFHVYDYLKDQPGVESCLSVAVRCVRFASRPVVSAGKKLRGFVPQSLVNSACQKAVSAAEKVDDTCVRGAKAAGKVVERIKSRTVQRSHPYVVQFVNSPLGYFVIQLCSLLITIMTFVLGRHGDQYPPGRGADGREREDGVLKKRATSSIERMTGRPGMVGVFTWILTAPFRILVSSLWFLRNTLIPYRTDTSDIFTPSRGYMSRRRRLTPVKRAPTRSFLLRFMSHTLAFLGIRPIQRLSAHKPRATRGKAIPIMADDAGLIPEKRRFSDVSEESVSEDDMHYLDEGMEDYISEEDPDFEPCEGGSDDSYEYEEGDTESFLELEDDVIESPGKRKTKTSKRAITEVHIQDLQDGAKSHETKEKKPSFAEVTLNKSQEKEKEKEKSHEKGKSHEKEKPGKGKDLKVDLKRVDVGGKENSPKREKKKSSSKSGHLQDKENQAPENMKALSPTKTSALRPQNASSPVLKPEWQRKQNPQEHLS